MTDKSLLCFGYGYTAAALARRLRAEGWRIAGSTRNAEKAEALKAEGVAPIVWEGGTIDPSWLDGVSAMLVSVPPDDEGCPVFRAVKAELMERKNTIKWIGYLSTNGVYGDHDGAWVDEDSALKASSPRAKRRLLAEEQWRSLADMPTVIFRLPGIYGPGRSAIDTVRAGKAKRIHKEGQVFSRMHVDDIAQALALSIDKPPQHDVYNLADDEPAPPQEVIAYACALLGVAPPPLIPIGEADLSDMARSFYADNKRVSNARIKEEFGVKLLYPTYKDGLRSIFEAEDDNKQSQA